MIYRSVLWLNKQTKRDKRNLVRCKDRTENEWRNRPMSKERKLKGLKDLQKERTTVAETKLLQCKHTKKECLGSGLNVIWPNMNILLNFMFTFSPQMCLMLNVYLHISMSQMVIENILFLMKIQYNKWLTSCSCFEISLVLNCLFFSKSDTAIKRKLKS